MLGANRSLPDYKRPKRGMIVRSEVTLPPGERIYRIASTRVNGAAKTEDDMITSPWWIRRADYDEIVRRSEMSGTGVSDLWRLFGAIAKQWGASCDRVVSARLAQPLAAFLGPGTIQDMRADPNPNDDLPLWVPPPYITQVYIPALWSVVPGSGKTLARVALTDIQIRAV
ncbi:MAG TPA: hypothetical protein VF041_19375 [Gemmatimonadaceae bacterium]